MSRTINFARYGQTMRKVLEVPGTPHDRIEISGLDPETGALVRDWFAGVITPLRLDGARSVHLSAPHRPGGEIKIKGAGLFGKGINWSRHRAVGPKAPLFDFEGRFMEDIASGHDNALEGGATFQQVNVEALMTKRIERSGRSVVPCLGTGKITYGTEESWFIVFDWYSDWRSANPNAGFDIDVFRELSASFPDTIIELSVEIGVVGYHWYIFSNERILWKDLHAYRGIDPFSFSALSWVLQVQFAIHIHCNQIEFAGIPSWGPRITRDAILWPLERLVPGVTLEDHAALRRDIVIPYMIAARPDFAPQNLAKALAANPITAALLDRCPPAFVRW